MARPKRAAAVVAARACQASANAGERMRPALGRTGGVILVALFDLTACSSSPSRNILGSYFPSWMICALAGMCATIAVRWFLMKFGIDQEMPMPLVVYLALTIAFTFAIWLLWLA
jgi:hypothetical protein